jgi:hypothetical protein
LFYGNTFGSSDDPRNTKKKTTSLSAPAYYKNDKVVGTHCSLNLKETLMMTIDYGGTAAHAYGEKHSHGLPR